MTITATHTNRLKADWTSIAKEELTIELISGTFYAFCSELASLRLMNAYRETKTAACGYSENLNTFFFRLETGL